MTVAEMRSILGLSDSVPDAAVVDAYVAYLEGQSSDVELITLDEVKAHLKVTSADEDDLIQAYLDAAIGTIDGRDGWLGRSITPRTLTARLDHLYCCTRLPYPPVTSVISVELADGTVVSSDIWTFEDGVLRLIDGQRWPASSEYRVIYAAGYSVLPAPIRAACLLMVGDMYRFRETAAVGVTAASAIPMSTTVETLLQPYRVYSL